MNITSLRSRIRVPRDPLQDVVFRALDRIASVHAVSNMPVTPLVITEGPRFGGYAPEREDEPRHFELSRFSPYFELTVTHEIGHYLDHLLGNFEDYSSSLTYSPLAEVMEAVNNTQAVTDLRAAIHSSSNLLITHRYQILYWLEPQEQWARSYAQFIAIRAGDALLLEEIEAARNLDGPAVFRNVQWEHNDFGNVASAIEIAFRNLGWML